MAATRDIRDWVAEEGCTCACCRIARTRPVSRPVQTPEETAQDVARWRQAVAV